MALRVIPFRRSRPGPLSPRRLAELLSANKPETLTQRLRRPLVSLPTGIRTRGKKLAYRLPVVRERQRRNRNRYLIPLLAAGGVAGLLVAREVLQRVREMDLEGRVVIITGGSRGLGFLLAREFLRQGANVAICARDTEELLLAERELEGIGGQVFAYRCDVSDPSEVEQFVQLVSRRLGPPDVLVNNAGVLEVGPLESMDHDDFRKAMDVMFWGVLNPTLAVLPYMREKHSGRIVNITSIGGLVSMPHLLAYCSAKFAATGFSEGLRAELAGTGIRVTTVSPGLMRTGTHVNAYYKGHGREEFRWLSLMDGAPVISMDAERAARQIVRAAKRGEAQTYPLAPRKRPCAPPWRCSRPHHRHRLARKPRSALRRRRLTARPVAPTSSPRWTRGSTAPPPSGAAKPPSASSTSPRAPVRRPARRRCGAAGPAPRKPRPLLARRPPTDGRRTRNRVSSRSS